MIVGINDISIFKIFFDVVFDECETVELILSADKGSFISFTFLSGEGFVDDIPYQQFDTFFLPYGKSCQIKGNGTLIVSSVNK